MAYKITDGQNKLSLFTQLHDIGREITRSKLPTIELTIKHPFLKGDGSTAEVHVYITGIVAKDNTGDNWQLQGYLSHSLTWNGIVQDSAFEAVYSTRTRKGVLTIS